MDRETLKDKIIKECTGYYDLGALKNIMTKPQVFETSEMAIPDKELNYQGGVALGPFVQYQLFFLFLIVLCIAIPLSNYIDKTDKLGKTFILAFIILYIIGFIIYKNIKSLHREIKIDRNGITLSEEEFQWTDIYRTFILTAKAPSKFGSREAVFLVIVDKNGIIIKHDITFLSSPKNLLATIIEYFKTKNDGAKN